MRAPINEYYTDKEYEYALRQMRRLMEYKRIQMEATVALQSRKKHKEDFEKNIEIVASQTKSTIQAIQKELDTGIKGASREKLEQLIEDELQKYDQIV